MSESKQVYAYDIETLKSYFSAAFIDIDTGERFLFEVYRVKSKKVNDIRSLLKFLRTCKGMIGYNNLFFDYPVLHLLLTAEEFVTSLRIPQLLELIYERAQDLIKKRRTFKYKVPDYKVIIPQLDLIEMNYFNSKAKFVSLKGLEFVMRYHNVQDMPYSHKFRIRTTAQAKEIADYNFNDVDATLMFYKKCEAGLELRRGLSRKYKMNLMNAPETKLAKEIFAVHLLEEMKISRQELNKMRTKRDIIDVGKQVILPVIKFENENLNKLLEYFKLQKVNKLKGFFKDIQKGSTGYNLLKEISTKSFINKAGTIECLNVEFNNHVYMFGNGGIHSKVEGKAYVCNEDEIIVDADVASYYPNLCIKLGFKPEHMGEIFLKVYEYIYNERQKFPKGTIENAIMKLILNSSFGQSGNEHSYLFDLLMTISICINGQLLLMMLNEQIVKIGGIITSSNTDGSSILIKRDKVDELNEIFKWWQELTGLTLEFANYTAQYYKDVNRMRLNLVNCLES